MQIQEQINTLHLLTSFLCAGAELWTSKPIKSDEYE